MRVNFPHGAAGTPQSWILSESGVYCVSLNFFKKKSFFFKKDLENTQ